MPYAKKDYLSCDGWPGLPLSAFHFVWITDSIAGMKIKRDSVQGIQKPDLILKIMA